jgi:DNA-binding MarR family transcriptional regulator
LVISILDRRLTHLLGRVAGAAGRDANAALAELGFDVRHYALMATIEAADSPSQRTVADTLNIDRATVVALIDDLEARGLARRERSARDRRANELQLTGEGRRALERAHALMDKCEGDFVAALEPAERERLGDLLQRLLQSRSRVSSTDR